MLPRFRVCGQPCVIFVIDLPHLKVKALRNRKSLLTNGLYISSPQGRMTLTMLETKLLIMGNIMFAR